MREKLLVTGVGLILVYLAWAWGGLQQAWLLPAVWVAAGLLMVLLISTPSRLKWLWRDVFFYGGLLFLGYLALQWWNAGRVLFFDVGLREWRYAAAPYPGWPSAFSRADAAQMVTWFFPAWVLGLVVRSPGIGSRSLLKLLRALVYGAGLLSLLGVIQFVTQAKARYWVRPTDEFFASFGYTNHAAAYFVLMGAVAAGLLYREIFKEGGARYAYRTVALTTALFLCLVGANLSLSRAGVILAWALAGFVAVYGLVRGWRRLRFVRRLNLAVATIAVLFVFYFAVAGFGEKEILKEFAVRKPVHHRLFPVLDNVNLSMGGRLELDKAAWRIWRDHKLLGIGGWGFRYLLALYLPPEEWKTCLQSPGKANVHCDILQFLAEFGVIGFGLMLTAVTSLILSLFPIPLGERAGVRVSATSRDPLWVMGVIGLSLVVIFSLIDLPFRCPAILCTWVVILAALPRVTEVRIQESEARIHNNR